MVIRIDEAKIKEIADHYGLENQLKQEMQRLCTYWLAVMMKDGVAIKI